MTGIIEGMLTVEELDAIHHRMVEAARLEREAKAQDMARDFMRRQRDEAIIRAAEAQGLLTTEETR